MASSLAVQTVGSAASFAAASTKASVATKASAAHPVRAFTGLKQQNALCTPSKGFASQTVSNGSRIQAMKSWTPLNNKKFETLSYLPPLSPQQILRQVDYLLAQGWSPCVEFDADGFIHTTNHQSPGYYDGRYWTMWKLPMFGCRDAGEVLREVEECKRTYPGVYVRVLGFNRRRQVQAASFIVYKPDQGSSNNGSSWQPTQSSQSSSRSSSWDSAPAQSSNRSSSSRSSSSRSWEEAPSFFGGGSSEAPREREAPRQAPRRSSSSRSWEDTPSFFG